MEQRVDFTRTFSGDRGMPNLTRKAFLQQATASMATFLGSGLSFPRSLNAQTPKEQSATYTVVAGDTASVIARKTGLSSEALRCANPDVNWSKIRVGQQISLQHVDPSECSKKNCEDAKRIDPTERLNMEYTSSAPRCETCLLFIPDSIPPSCESVNSARCQIIRGPISPIGRCKSWVQR